MNTIKELVNSSHANAVTKGFYDSVKSITKKMYNSDFTSQEIRDVENAFIAQRLMLTVSELGEALEANRKDHVADIDTFENHSTDDFNSDFKDCIKNSFQDELADTAIRLFDLAGWLGIDLEKHIELKAKYNSMRENMHGKKY